MPPRRTHEGNRSPRRTAAEPRLDAGRLLETLWGMGDAIVATDDEGRVARLNAAAAALTGSSERDMAGRPLRDVLRVVDADTHATVDDLPKRIRSANATLPIPPQAWLIAKDGREHPVVGHGAPIWNEKGESLGVVLVMRDRTAELEAERTLLRSEHRHRSTMDAMIEGCQILDFDWRYVYLNATAEAHGRRPRAELLGRRFADMWPGVAATELFQKIRACLVDRVADHMENEFEYPDGRVGWFDLRFEPVPEGVLILSVDIAERKLHELRVQHLNKVLEAIRKVHQAIAREKDAERLVKRACDILVDTRSYRTAWIALDAGPASAPILAQTGCGGAFAEFRVRLGEGWTPPCRRRLESANQRMAVLQPDTDCAGCPLWNPDAHGVAGVVPVRREGRDLGVLTICRAPGLEHNDEEAELLAGIVDDLGFALHGIATERGRAAYELIVANTQDAVALVRPDGVCLEANAAYARLVGRPLDEIRGRPMADVLGADDFQGVVLPRMRRCFAGETVVHESTRHVPGDGDITAEMQYSPYFGDDGRVVSAVVSVRDITQHKRTEAALRESQKRFSMIFHHSPVGIVFTRAADGLIVDVNEAFAAIHGYEREQLLGRSSVEMQLWADPDARAGMIRRLFEHGHEEQLEIRFRRKDGEVRTLSITAKPIEWNGEKFTIGMAEDVTDRRRDEHELHVRNVLLAAQQEASVDGVLVLDEHDRHLMRNQRFGEMWQVPQDVLDSGSDEDIRRAVASQVEDPAAFLADVHRLMADREARATDELRLKDGRVFQRFTAPMIGPDGGYFGRIFHFRDLTERRRAEARSTKLEEQLRVSQKMEAIGTLAGGVAHDFNNLLVVILNYAQFALDALPADSRTRGDLLEVKKAGERAAGLTRQLLAFSRRQVLQPVRLDVNQVAEGIEPMLRRILGEDVEFTLELARDTGQVLADPGQLEQVLMNLVVNARDAMPEGGRLRVRTSAVELRESWEQEHADVVPGPYAQIEVSDTGHGMDEATRLRIFEPFFTTKPKERGTGLGLSTAYGIVKQSGGYIWVTSAPGRGTTFTIHLPRDRAGSAPQARAQSDAASARGTETVLVVEDEAALRELTRRFLESAGYTVVTAMDGTQALEILRAAKRPVDLVLTDVVMPRVGGGRLAQELSRHWPGIRVLYMSGYTDDAIENHGVLGPGMQFLPKPFTSNDLLRKVREVLDGPVDSGPPA